MTHFIFTVLCLISVAQSKANIYKFDPEFLWGIATALAHVEDQANDAWMELAEQGGVAAVPPEQRPNDRLLFWTQPEIEINQAAQLGIQIYRMGIDWQRLVPHLPGSQECNGVCPTTTQDRVALEHYRKIIHSIKSKNIKVMVTLFHHSPPKWFKENSGWKNPQTINYFSEWALHIMQEFEGEVDYWITFNEPSVYNLLTYVQGIWPYGEKGNWTAFLNLRFYQGSYAKAMSHMAQAHNIIYLKSNKRNIGIAHHLSYLTNNEGKTTWVTKIADYFWNWSFLDKVQNNLSFIGVNYYGAAYLSRTSPALLDDKDYSEAGRALAPNGLYEMLIRTYARYKIPIFITENGIADDTDILRPSYLLEHLAAIHHARENGVPVLGYIFWTLADNWEWADGYCPRFGLVRVTRENNLERSPRPSYFLFADIIKNNGFSQAMRDLAWENVTLNRDQLRPFCRNEDGIGSLEEPTFRKIKHHDWQYRRN